MARPFRGRFLGHGCHEDVERNTEAWFDLVLPDHAERLRAGLVTPNSFPCWEAHAALGRVFSPDDYAAGYDNLIVLSHEFWMRAYGGDTGSLAAGRPT